MTTVAKKTSSAVPVKKTTPGRPRKVIAPKMVSKAEPIIEEKPVEKETILIHFVTDGFTAFGYVWSKGQELEIEVPSPEYDRTCDTTGASWLRLTEEEQLARYAKVWFKSGPSNIPNSVINYRTLSLDRPDYLGRPRFNSYLSHIELQKAAELEKKRGRSIPVV